MAMASMANSSFTARHQPFMFRLDTSFQWRPGEHRFLAETGTPTMGISWDIPLVMCDIATENGHRKSWCTHFFNGDFPYLCDECVFNMFNRGIMGDQWDFFQREYHWIPGYTFWKYRHHDAIYMMMHGLCSSDRNSNVRAIQLLVKIIMMTVSVTIQGLIMESWHEIWPENWGEEKNSPSYSIHWYISCFSPHQICPNSTVFSAIFTHSREN